MVCRLKISFVPSTDHVVEGSGLLEMDRCRGKEPMEFPTRFYHFYLTQPSLGIREDLLRDSFVCPIKKWSLVICRTQSRFTEDC